MKIKRFVSVFLFLVILCNLIVVLTSCGAHQSIEDCDTTTTITIKGLTATKKIKVHFINIATDEKYQVQCNRLSQWKTKVGLDYGTYRVEKVVVQGIDSEVTCNNQIFVVTEATQDVEIVASEIDHTGTLLWFLRKNALTLLGVVGCVVGLSILKSKRDKKLHNPNGMT